jgi:hypothetical protein
VVEVVRGCLVRRHTERVSADLHAGVWLRAKVDRPGIRPLKA